MKLLGANPEPAVTGVEKLPGKSNYFIGNDPEKWRTNVPHYARVAYEEVYPGIDLVFYGKQQQLEFDFVVSPGTDPAAIGLDFGGVEELALNEGGDLLLRTEAGEALLRAPDIYQEIDGSRVAVKGGYDVRGESQIAFQVASYDPAKPLIIDPVLVYSLFLGGSGSTGFGITVDAEGNAYIAGTAPPTLITTPGAFQDTILGHRDAYVQKLNPAGDSLIYSTFLGGTDGDGIGGIALDGDGNTYVTGTTDSLDFPTTPNAVQRTFAGGIGDSFVAKLNAEGTELLYSTYLGGSDSEVGLDIAVDADGNAHVTGRTQSEDFPLANAIQTVLTNQSAYIRILDPVGETLLFSTYLGGGSESQISGTGIAVDIFGNAYVTGITGAITSGFPTTPGAFMTDFVGGDTGFDLNAVFVTKMNPTGDGLIYSTFLGPGSDLVASHIALDDSGRAYLTGATHSENFPLVDPIRDSHDAGQLPDPFIAVLNSAGSELLFSTYFGGRSSNLSDFESGNSIAVDTLGNFYVAGVGQRTNFPITHELFTFTATWGAFVAKISLGPLETRPVGLEFPDQPVSTSSDVQNITVTNTSAAPVIITSVAVGQGYDETSNCNGTLGAGQACTVSVTFIPAETGIQTGKLTISIGSDGTYTVPLSGTGVSPVLFVSPSLVFFGDQDVETTSSPRTITVTNTGMGALTILGVAVSGDYDETDDCGSTLAPDGSCTATVTFTPTGPGTRAGAITFTSDDPNSPHTVSLSGTGVGSGSATGVSLNTSQTTVTISAGQTATYTLSLQAMNGFEGQVMLSCSGAPQAAACYVSPSSVSINGTTGATATVTVETTARAILLPLLGPESGLPWLPWLLTMALLGSLAARMRRITQPSVFGLRRAWVSLPAMLLFVALWTSCGSGGPALGGGTTPLPGGGGGTTGTPAGTSTITVTATSGAMTRTLPLTLTVN